MVPFRFYVCPLIVAFLFLLSPLALAAAEFRILAIPRSERFFTQSITTQARFDQYIKGLQEGLSWPPGPRKDLIAALNRSKCDFSKEALILLSHSENSGMTPVDLETPKLEGENLVCSLKVEKVTGAVTMDIGHHSFALAVDKSRIKTVVFRAPGRHEQVLSTAVDTMSKYFPPANSAGRSF